MVSTLKEFFYTRVREDDSQKILSLFDGRKSKTLLELTFSDFRNKVENFASKLPQNIYKTIIYLNDEVDWWVAFFSVTINVGTVIIVNDRIEIEYITEQIIEAKPTLVITDDSMKQKFFLISEKLPKSESFEITTFSAIKETVRKTSNFNTPKGND